MWKKTNDKGEYFSVSLDLDALAELRGGQVDGKIDLNAYVIPFEKVNPRAPDYRVKFYTRNANMARPAASPRQPAAPPLQDDDPLF
jgi:uncharacterized protein (DUF736 family)